MSIRNVIGSDKPGDFGDVSPAEMYGEWNIREFARDVEGIEPSDGQQLVQEMIVTAVPYGAHS